MQIEDGELERCTARKGDLLICEGGEAGRAAVWECDKEVCFQNHIHRARFLGDLIPHYFYRLFERLNFTGEINQYRKGVAISSMSGKTLSSIPFPLPPVPEQHRIVAKVDELMALCDRLETRQADAESAHAQLVQALLGSLNQARDANDFATSWQRLSAHFHTLFTTESSIDALKQAVLELAVKGKLVPQNPINKPVSELLNLISFERDRLTLIATRAPKQQGSLDTADLPFDIPGCWSWIRLGEIATVVDPNPSHRMPRYTSSGIPFISTENFSEGDSLDFCVGKKVPQSILDEQVGKFDIRDGAFAISRIGTIGKTRPLPSERNYCLSHALCVISPFLDVFSSRYLRLAMTAESVLSHAHSGVKSIGVPDLGVGTIRSMPIPVPPAEEQRLIVAKVDQLMALCDQLKSRLTQARQLNQQLASTLVQQAVA